MVYFEPLYKCEFSKIIDGKKTDMDEEKKTYTNIVK